MTLKELRQQRATKASRGKAATQEFNTLSAKETLTDAETATLAALDTELNALEADVEALDAKIATAEATQKRATLFAGGARAALDAGRTANELNPETSGGFKNLSEFAVSVRGAMTGLNTDNRLASFLEATNPSTFNQNAGSGGEGFLVPPDFSRSIWELALDDLDLFGMAAPEPTQSNSVFKPKDESTPWGAVGVQAYWGAEAGQLTASKLATTGELMTLHKLHAFCAASDEVISDAPMLTDRLTRQAGRAIRWKAGDAVMWGTGAGQLTGFMKSPALVTVAKESGQAADTIVVLNLLKMAARVLRTGGRPMWIANSDILPQLGTLTIGNVPAYLPYNQPLRDSPFEGALLGYPIMFSEHAATLGDTGDIACMNLDGYYAANKSGGVDFAQSIHLFFDTGLTAFRWTFRVAGQPYLSKPVSPARGSSTKSHFVTLAERT